MFPAICFINFPQMHFFLRLHKLSDTKIHNEIMLNISYHNMNRGDGIDLAACVRLVSVARLEMCWSNKAGRGCGVLQFIRCNFQWIFGCALISSINLSCHHWCSAGCQPQRSRRAWAHWRCQRGRDFPPPDLGMRPRYPRSRTESML